MRHPTRCVALVLLFAAFVAPSLEAQFIGTIGSSRPTGRTGTTRRHPPAASASAVLPTSARDPAAGLPKGVSLTLGPGSLTLQGGTPNAAVLLVASPARIDKALPGGVLVPDPGAAGALLIVLVADGKGEVSLPLPAADLLPADSVLWLQAWVPDRARRRAPQASAAVVLSRGPTAAR